MFLEQINRRLASLKEKMDSQTQAPRKAAKKAVKAAKIAGTKTMGIQLDPKLYDRIRRFKEQRGYNSMKRAVLALCEEALTNMGIN